MRFIRPQQLKDVGVDMLARAASVACFMFFAIPAHAEDDFVSFLQAERYLQELGYFEGLEDIVDGDISGPTWDILHAFADKHGIEWNTGFPEQYLLRAIRDAALEKRQQEGTNRPSRQMAEIPLPASGSMNFDYRFSRSGVDVAIATRHDCSDGVAAMAIISDDPSTLPTSVDVANALINASSRQKYDCQKVTGLQTIMVLNSQGRFTGHAYLFRRGTSSFALPYRRLTVDMINWLENDPGLPFAYIVPDFLPMLSGDWRDGPYLISGETQMRSILFNFALADASLCDATVGETKTYVLTKTQSDEWGTTVDESEFTFDAEWEATMLSIIAEGNHLGARLHSFSRELIAHYGCSSQEITMLREDLIAFGRNFYQQ